MPVSKNPDINYCVEHVEHVEHNVENIDVSAVFCVLHFVLHIFLCRTDRK